MSIVSAQNVKKLNNSRAKKNGRPMESLLIPPLGARESLNALVILDIAFLVFFPTIFYCCRDFTVFYYGFLPVTALSDLNLATFKK